MLNYNMKPDPIVQALMDHRITTATGVPIIWQMVRKQVSSDAAKYAQLKEHFEEIYCGGSSPPIEMMKWYNTELGVDFIHAWGMTETNPLGTISKRVMKSKEANQSAEERWAKLQYQGLPIPGLFVEVVDLSDFNKALPHDGKAAGELLISGPWVCGGYYKGRGKEKFFTGHGRDWLCTGDIAAINAEGYVILKDRSKDMVKSGGEWISSVDMENLVASMPQVDKAAVVGVPHPKFGERPVVMVTLNADQTLTLEEVRAHLSQKFAKFQLPDDVIVDKIPVSGTGKIQKKVIRQNLKDSGYVLPKLRKAES